MLGYRERPPGDSPGVTGAEPTCIPAEQIGAAGRRLAAAGIEGAWQEAQRLAEHARTLPAGEQGEAFDALVARRAERVPLERLTGRVRFREIELLVGPGVFVPQPERSPVVQWAVDALTARLAARREDGRAAGAGLVCVDLCTGSGTVALSLAAEVPRATVHAVETDERALAWAARNVEHNGLAVILHAGDAASALPELDGTVDLVASNPPYVATGELDGVAPEVRDHDPAVALEAGHDGLDVIRAVEATARRLLRPSGLVVVEHSDRQGRSAPAVFEASGAWAEVTDHPDQDGLDRFVTAVRRD